MSDAVERAEGLARAFAERAAVYDRDATFPADDIADLRSSGLLGLMVPTRLGGMGAGFEEYTDVAVALASGSGATALLFNMHASVTGALAAVPDETARELGATEAFFERRDEALRRAAEGALYGVAISEPETGSSLSAIRTAYEAHGDGYRIRGSKATCSGAGFVDAYLVAARAASGVVGTDEGEVSYFLVPSQPGMAPVGSWDPIGMRATVSRGLEIDVSVDGDALLGGVEGLALPLAAWMPQWLVASYAAVYVGLAEAAVAHATAFLRARGERPPARVWAARERLGRAGAAVAAARLVVREAARRVDVDPGSTETNAWVYRAKLVAGDTALSVASSLTEACGLGSLARGMPLERILRDARCGAIMPPTSDLAAAYLGTAELGDNPDEEVRPW